MADEVKKPDLAVTSEPPPVKEVTVQASPEQTTACECLYWLGLFYALAARRNAALSFVEAHIHHQMSFTVSPAFFRIVDIPLGFNARQALDSFYSWIRQSLFS
ncbi:hypothetical protein OUZ56_030432 [Daphnia magna]|uniref:Uncharacterized protein n=1 Tax=Daphnia magna TaxID=35525 RepID=A0ABQ9ZR98_9CRUS|nr:hypothetical protein OUZ56_030432 [Daphnia magna]